MAKYTVQWTDYGVVECETYGTRLEAEARMRELIAEAGAGLSEVLICDGTENGAPILAEWQADETVGG